MLSLSSYYRTTTYWTIIDPYNNEIYAKHGPVHVWLEDSTKPNAMPILIAEFATITDAYRMYTELTHMYPRCELSFQTHNSSSNPQQGFELFFKDAPHEEV